jgi:hypothetical protein
MSQSTVIERHPNLEILYCAPDITKEEIYQRVKPYFEWRLVELDAVHNDILICTPPNEENKQMIILQGHAAQVWLLCRRPRSQLFTG